MKSRLLWCVLAVPCVGLAAGPSGMEILERTAAAYRSLQSYEFRVTVQTIQGAKVSERHWTETGLKPGKYRVKGEDPHSDVRVSDGSTEWLFDPAKNEYRSSPAGPARTSAAAFEQIDQHVKTAGIAREEQFAMNGKLVPIYVVRVLRDQWPDRGLNDPQFAMYRIDQKTFAVYKVITYYRSATQIEQYSMVKWNQSVPAALFAFKPPAGAREVSAVSTAAVEPASIVGSEAPDFTLHDGSGRPFNLRGLRGKVVIVDFWATWCGPCRALMPELEKMHRQLADKGLVILGLDVGEESATVAKFAKQQGYTFTLLLGAEPDVSARYFVEGYPTTFVIDRRGRIAFREIGGGSPGDLRSAVEAALRAGS